MPFVRENLRKIYDEAIFEIIDTLKDEDRPCPILSYIFLKLLVEVLGDSIDGLIQGIGTIEETKLTYFSMLMQPIEERIILKRWLNPEVEL